MASVQIFSTAAADGPSIGASGFGGTFADARGAAAGTSNSSSARSYACLSDYNVSAGAAYTIARGFLVFDLATNIPAGATITAATLSVYCYAKDTTNGGNVCLVASTQASASALANSDYPQVGTTEFMARASALAGSATTFANFTTGAYNVLTLNASGVSHLTTNQTGNAKLAFRTSFDLDNSAPTTISYMAISYSDQTGSSEDPYITVTYTPAPAGGSPLRRRPSGLYVR